MTRLEIARKHSCLPRDVSGPAISPRRQHRVSAVNTEGIEFHRSLLEQEDYSSNGFSEHARYVFILIRLLFKLLLINCDAMFEFRRLRSYMLPRPTDSMSSWLYVAAIT